jgi:hypothetical protein
MSLKGVKAKMMNKKRYTNLRNLLEPKQDESNEEGKGDENTPGNEEGDGDEKTSGNEEKKGDENTPGNEEGKGDENIASDIPTSGSEEKAGKQEGEGNDIEEENSEEEEEEGTDSTPLISDYDSKDPIYEQDSKNMLKSMEKEDKGLSKIALSFIIIGSLLFVFIVAVLIIYVLFYIRARRRKENGDNKNGKAAKEEKNMELANVTSDNESGSQNTDEKIDDHIGIEA